jgi:hypothetical protein
MSICKKEARKKQMWSICGQNDSSLLKNLNFSALNELHTPHESNTFYRQKTKGDYIYLNVRGGKHELLLIYFTTIEEHYVALRLL